MPAKIDGILSSLEEGRRAIVDRLVEKNWFKKSPFEVQKTLLELPKGYDGMLRELSIRSDNIGNVEIISMNKIISSGSLAILNFKARSILTNEQIEYEYFCHMSGNNPNCRGIVLVEESNEIKYFILKKSVDFAAGTTVLGSISSYYPEFSNNNLVSLPSKIESQIKKMLGNEKLNIKRYIDLGGVFTDSLMTSNYTSLYAIIVANENTTINQQSNDLEMESIDKLGLYINKANDGYFLAIISKLAALNIINLNYHE